MIFLLVHSFAVKPTYLPTASFKEEQQKNMRVATQDTPLTKIQKYPSNVIWAGSRILPVALLQHCPQSSHQEGHSMPSFEYW